MVIDTIPVLVKFCYLLNGFIMSFNTRLETRRVSISFAGEELLTEQNHAEMCDVHSIVKRFERTQMFDHVSSYGAYGDYISGLDFHSAMNQIAEAESMFETIPSKLRAEFGNDPARFLSWIQDENNRDEIEGKGFSTSHLPILPPSEAADALNVGSPDRDKAKSKRAADAISDALSTEGES
ncbi:MAG: internal scaffolding protein [Microviridae sp.]|nr:MAG: internal scaffolding protein [Microviridae sp.]